MNWFLLKTSRIEAWKLSHLFSHGFRVTKQRKQERERERLVPENRERSFGGNASDEREREREREASSSHYEKLLCWGQGCLWENDLFWGYFGKTKWLDLGPKIGVCRKSTDPSNPIQTNLTCRVRLVFRAWWVGLDYKKKFIAGRVGFGS